MLTTTSMDIINMYMFVSDLKHTDTRIINDVPYIYASYLIHTEKDNYKLCAMLKRYVLNNFLNLSRLEAQ